MQNYVLLAELSEARAQAHSLGGDDCPRGQGQGLWRGEAREAEAGPEVPQLFFQLVQPPQCICLHLAPAPALLDTQLRGQGQAAGGGRDLLLHGHLALQGLESQLLSRAQGAVCWVGVRCRVGSGGRGPPADQLRPFPRLQRALGGQLAGQLRLLETHFAELLKFQAQGLLQGSLPVKQSPQTL